MLMLTQVQVRQAMDRVLAVRYSDLELEHSLCQELLAHGEAQQDRYATAFAHTYLGDYFVAKGDIPLCASHLGEARNLAIEGKYDDLLARACCLLGLSYEMIADEPSSLRYFMEGVAAARRVNDTATEGLILNNIANSFQWHHGYEHALRFYKEAYELMQQSAEGHSPTACIILSNLASVSVLLGCPEEAKAYIEQCQAQSEGSEIIELLSAQNWCQYYAATGDSVQAMEWANQILSKTELVGKNEMYAFSIYSALFDSMICLCNAPAASRFLALMEACCADASSDHRRQLEDSRMAYILSFETEQENLDVAYQSYCHSVLELNKLGDQVISNGMRTAIRLHRVEQQKGRLTAAQSSLKHQVNLDELTQVYTRRYLDELIRQQESAPSLDFLGFIMVDVDCLKEYNDTYGHPAGDEALRAVGACLREHAAGSIYPCRFGGDEFVCFCAGMTDEQIISYLCAVRDSLQKRNIPHRSSHCAQRVTLSIGFSNAACSSGTAPRTLLEQADKALYNAKINGRNTYCQHSP